MLGAMPVLEMLSDLISHINFGAAVKASQQENEDIMNAFLVMPSAASLIKVFLVLAIVPAMGEEMFFRGVLMRFAKKRSNSMVLPIVFTAFVFAFAHASVYGFLSIFIAGILLAFIYNLTGSLWCSILAHLFFNGSQIVLSYLSNGNAAAKQATDNAGIPYYLVAAGAVVFGISFYLLLKNKTPLPPNWTDDFTPAELQQEQNLNSK
jgi:membrane protease YdiL (CAAX protease family)